MAPWGRDQPSDTQSVLLAYSHHCLLGLDAPMRQASMWERSSWQGTEGRWFFVSIRWQKGQVLMGGSQRPEVDVTHVTSAHILLVGKESHGPCTCRED